MKIVNREWPENGRFCFWMVFAIFWADFHKIIFSNLFVRILNFQLLRYDFRIFDFEKNIIKRTRIVKRITKL